MDNSGVRQDAGMTIPYGAWPSPISAADRARGSLSLSFPGVVGGDVWWTEGRPDESGRQAIVRTGADGRPVDLLPPPWNARTRVHEYGGRSWLAVPPSSGAGVPHGSAGAGAPHGSAGAGAPHGSDGYALVFANYADQRLYRLDPGAAEPVPITPEPASPAAERYADLTLTPDGSEIWCVRESHADGAVSRALVAVPVGGGAPGRRSSAGRCGSSATPGTRRSRTAGSRCGTAPTRTGSACSTRRPATSPTWTCRTPPGPA